ncbi:[FeFe] hydrogenase H-cluster radical SAM maturase HydG [Gallalistipes aquisgranensis]|uniref:[FeFe] hydrogenase H-cluster radical SAM maturase HydG n=1 Tax=Gallalistipes aquisgranensis TaxID=2779358 RepID=UPI001CF873E3|nr:[FeFe] hydrogenase H-cluster radical SAM maturase HydG [Gallalistipes aquisgranensis]MBE5033801.1 [FeFe] hydrogenase H-cluster radical SAM maturase HydG [Gallalistipes aquisgranensis]
MLFNPQICNLKDEKFRPFISVEEIEAILRNTRNPSPERVQAVVDRSLGLARLSMEETAVLLNARGEEAERIILEGARTLKRRVYGDRIVLFAPLYIGNRCINNCAYCGFRAGNRDALRRTLTDAEIESEVRGLEEAGQKRLILVYGEHPDYSAEYIARTARVVYGVRQDNGRINRVNINAAPFDIEGFRTVKEAGIGTYQIFQETYHPGTYKRFHLGGRKADYEWRLTAMDRAMEAGIDDVGLGVLFGLGDWRFEVLALVRHVNHLEACFGVGPHTISFPRIQNASNLDRTALSPVADDDFIRLVAVLRLAVPYTGLILTAREPRNLRDRLIGFGVSQIDAGTQLEIGGYTEHARRLAQLRAAEKAGESGEQNLHREQFELMDTRSLAETIGQLVEAGQIPSFCTACYRKGRTGEHFMEFSTKGFIKSFCTPNALLTFAEWLEDYAPEGLRVRGRELIGRRTAELDPGRREEVGRLLERIRNGERDLLL